MPTTTDAFDPFDLAFDPFDLPLLALALAPDEEFRFRDEEFRFRDEAEEDRRLDALALLLPALLALPPELAGLLFEALVLEAVDLLRVEPLARDPFELLEDRFCLLDELGLAWAIPSPWGREPCLRTAYPVGTAQNAIGTILQETAPALGPSAPLPARTHS